MSKKGVLALAVPIITGSLKKRFSGKDAVTSRVIRVLPPAVVVLLGLLWVASAAAQDPRPGPGKAVVHTAHGGFILGYDIDQTGTEGVLSEALTLGNGNHDVAVETFDQKTGKITKVVIQQNDSKNDFVTFGIVGSHVGLVEYERVKKLFVEKRAYRVMNPISGRRFSGPWTPPLTKNDIIIGVTPSQGASTTAFLAFENGGNNKTFVFSSDVAANTFGPTITLTDPNFFFANSPKIALDSVNNRAVLGTLASPFGPPTIATVDLATGAFSKFTGVGIGYVNGIAVDPETGIACTTTEIDFSVEFYDLATQTGFAVPLPGAVSQAQSGADVQFDPIHKLFLIGQPMTSTGGSGSSIQVFDEQGNFIESINGLRLPVSPTLIALHPSQRFGYVLVTPDLTSLQSFTY
jgi:hypothetical protein